MELFDSGKPLLDYFPFKTPRPMQIESLELIDKAFATGKKYVILEAPVGAGKSPMAISIARKYGDAHILTSQKLLQAQYHRDFKDIFVMQGKSNYWCDINRMYCGSRDCNQPTAYCNSTQITGRKYEGPVKFGQDALRALKTQGAAGEAVEFSGVRDVWNLKHKSDTYQLKACEYRARKTAAMISDITIHNFQSFLYQGVLAGGFEPRKMLVIDEAHNIEGVIMQFFTIEIRDIMFPGCVLPEFRDLKHIIQFLTEDDYSIPIRTEKLTHNVTSNMTDEKSRLAYLRILKIIAINDGQYTEAQHYERIIQKIELFISYVANNVDFVFEVKKGYSKKSRQAYNALLIKPVYIKFWMNNLFDMGDKVFLTSATILDRDIFCRNLGLRIDDCVFIQMPSEFPVANRPIFVMNDCLPLSYATTETCMPKILEYIDKICTCDKYKSERGIIHTHSFEITKRIKAHVKSSRFLFADDFDGNRQKMLERHATGYNTILVSPSMHEGLDLYDDMSRFQIIIKLPYPGMDVQVKCRLNKYRDQSWYNWLTALKLVQSYGRSIRHKDDWADTYILDGAFKKFYNTSSTKRLLPQWFLDAVSFH